MTDHDSEARVELARGEAGVVRSPTRAEIVIAALRAIALAPFATVMVLPFVAAASTRPGIKEVATGVATVVFGIGLVDLLAKTRERHVEHVRVTVWSGQGAEPYVLVALAAVNVLCAVAALVAL